MLSELLSYLIFLLETITIVAAVVIVLIIFFGLIAKAKSMKHTGEMRFKRLDDRLKDQKESLADLVMSKKERKVLHQAEKARCKSHKSQKHVKTIYVVQFEGDMHASQVSSLKEEVNAILQVATKQDEVLVCIESPGGVVHGYGLGAAQLERIRAKGIPLTVAVDKVAASGGYMMACVADKILAAPFAIVGSIGVVMQLPNFHKVLEKHGIAFEQVTAGEYKRTLTLFGKNSPKSRQKAQCDVNNMHALFKDFIRQYRPNLDFAKVATGEYWHAIEAKELGLIDTLQTADDYLLAQFEQKRVKLVEVKYQMKKSFSKRMSASLGKAVQQVKSGLY